MTTINETALDVNPNAASNRGTNARLAMRTAVIFDIALSSGACRLYFAIDDYAGSKGLAFPSQERLAQQLGVCPRTVQGWLRELVKRGYLDIRRFVSGNRYFLRWQEKCGKQQPAERAHAADCGSHTQKSAGAFLITEPDQEPKHQSDRTDGSNHSVEKPQDNPGREAILKTLRCYTQMGVRNPDGTAWDPGATADRLLHAARRLRATPFEVAA
jgi:hypothetical protein